MRQTIRRSRFACHPPPEPAGNRFPHLMTATLRSDADLADPITCILTDVDGVMTDGRIVYDTSGNEIKHFHVRDGLGIKLWMKAGFQFGIITARSSEVVRRRAAELGIKHVAQGSQAKLSQAEEFAAGFGCGMNNICYIGDDLPDIDVMGAVGIAASPADAALDARRSAQWVLSSRGGEGAVREVIERILRAKGQWYDTIERPQG